MSIAFRGWSLSEWSNVTCKLYISLIAIESVTAINFLEVETLPFRRNLAASLRVLESTNASVGCFEAKM